MRPPWLTGTSFHAETLTLASASAPPPNPNPKPYPCPPRLPPPPLSNCRCGLIAVGSQSHDVKIWTAGPTPQLVADISIQSHNVNNALHLTTARGPTELYLSNNDATVRVMRIDPIDDHDDNEIPLHDHDRVDRDLMPRATASLYRPARLRDDPRESLDMFRNRVVREWEQENPGHEGEDIDRERIIIRERTRDLRRGEEVGRATPDGFITTITTTTTPNRVHRGGRGDHHRRRSNDGYEDHDDEDEDEDEGIFQRAYRYNHDDDEFHDEDDNSERVRSRDRPRAWYPMGGGSTTLWQTTPASNITTNQINTRNDTDQRDNRDAHTHYITTTTRTRTTTPTPTPTPTDPPASTRPPRVQVTQTSRTLFETPINYTSVSPDGTRMACGGDSHCVYVCEARPDGSWATSRSLREFSDAVMMCDWSPSQPIFAAVSQDGTCAVWDVRQRRVVAHFSAQGAIRAVKFSAGPMDLIALAECERSIRLVDARVMNRWQKLSLPPPESLQARDDLISGLAFTPDGTSVVSGTEAAIFQWDINTTTRRTFSDGCLI